LTVLRKNILFVCSICITISIIFFIGFSVASQATYKERNLAKDFRQEFPKILETLNDQNYHQSSIDYKDPVLLSRNIFLTTDLDQIEATEVMQKIKFLESLDQNKPINLYINTAGGYGGIMLSNYLQTVSCKVNTIALDLCASAGCEVLTSGTGKRQAFSSSRIIVHIVTNSNDDRDDQEFSSINQQDKVNIIFWKKYSKLPETYYSHRDNEIFYCLTAEEAKQYGIIDEIIEK
jgi:ATP-dependent Clp protease, protease subunit